MKRRLIIANSGSDNRSWLYAVVYTSRISLVAVLFLFLSFLIQPFHEAMAAEELPENTEEEPAVADSVREQVEEDEPEPEPEPEVEEETDETEVADESEDAAVVEVESENEVPEDSGEETEMEDTDELPVDDDEVEVVETDETGTTDDTEDTETGAATSTDSQAEAAETETATSTDNGSESDATETASSTNEVADESAGNGTTSGGGSSGGGSSSNDNEEESDGDVPDSNVEGETASSSDEVVEDQDSGAEREDEVSSEPEASATSTPAADAETATSTVEEVEDTPVVQTEMLISNDNFYQFSRQSCVEVGDGTFHCSSNEVEDYDNQSVVYSDLGESGTLEIFLETSDGDIRQITDNEFDDTAPYYDAETLQIVWQRLIDGRYQIILYDIAEDEESQLTFSRTNNMEPKVSVDGVVWQAWDNNDWEIMYFDGRFTDQITDNNVQDVAPTIRDRYVLWTVIGRGDQEGKVFSLDSQELLTISGYDGGVIENPRFVLVYDQKFDNGDVITQGFDPTTGISEPIAAQPAPEPIDIPFNDPVGEIRALIQNKSSFEDDLDDELVHDGAATSTATSTDGTLDLTSDEEQTETVIDTTPTDGEEFELTEFDLILQDVEIDFSELDEIDELLSETPTEESASSTQQ